MIHLNELSISQHETKPLFKTQSWDDFKKCWNLPIYYQYRYFLLFITIILRF